MTFDLEFDLQGKFKLKGRGTGYRAEIMSARVPEWYQTIAYVPGQLRQP